MVSPMIHSVRTFLVVCLFALSAGAARAAETAAGDGPSIDGMLIIAGLVAAVVFIAWVASRFGDD